MMNRKKVLTLFLALCLSLNMLPTKLFGASFMDISGHWAEGAINALAGDGIVSGDGSGRFAPDNNVTRAEYFTMVNKGFQFTRAAEPSFTDVSRGDWFYQQIGTAVAAGYLSGYEDNTAKPNNPITRAEAGVILSRILELEANSSGQTRLNDYSSIPAWAKSDIDAVITSGIMVGDTNGNFRPLSNLTRAEAAVMINNSRYYEAAPVAEDEEETADLILSANYGGDTVETISRNVVTAGNLTLKNLVIDGDLMIRSANVTLDNVEVTGRIIIQTKADLYIKNGSETGEILATSGANIHTEDIGTGSVGKVTVNLTNAGSVQLYGSYGTVEILSARTTLILKTDGQIDELLVASSATTTTITIERNAVIEEAQIDVACTIQGSGKINSAYISVTGVRAARNIIQNYQTDSKKASAISSGGGGGGGSSSGGNGGGTKPPVDPPIDPPVDPTEPELPKYAEKILYNVNLFGADMSFIDVYVDSEVADYVDSVTYKGGKLDYIEKDTKYHILFETALTASKAEIYKAVKINLKKLITNTSNASYVSGIGANAYVFLASGVNSASAKVYINDVLVTPNAANTYSMSWSEAPASVSVRVVIGTSIDETYTLNVVDVPMTE